MKILKLTSQFKKDLKRYKHRKEQLDALEGILTKLRTVKLFQTSTNHTCYWAITRASWSVMSKMIYF
jgi:mRNA-degrading endonuclease YafQ of YafQ-DinJ toxin-antitoxin module